MSPLLYLLGILVFLAGIALSIGLHEIGHLVPAKRFGVRVQQYMIGFGPTLWSRRRGETEYGVKAIPLGGYIRMIGMFPPKRGEDPRMVRRASTGRMSLLMDQARAQSMEEIQPGDENRVFYKLSVPKKVVVMMGGPTMNLVIAIVLLTITTTLLGVPAASTSVETVTKCVLPTTRRGQRDLLEQRPAGPRGRGRPEAGRPDRVLRRPAGLQLGRPDVPDPGQQRLGRAGRGAPRRHRPDPADHPDPDRPPGLRRARATS